MAALVSAAAAAEVLPVQYGGSMMGPGGLFSPESDMMSNPAGFFAMTASCYLNGTVARDPYTREAIRGRQPDSHADLVRLFGPRGDAWAEGPDVAVAARRGAAVTLWRGGPRAGP